jgi:hypothetical protein
VFEMEKDWDKTMSRLWTSAVEPVASTSGRICMFTMLLMINFAWKKLISFADGEAIFDLVRFLLPLYATLGSTMYFRFLCNWTHTTLNMSPFDRALRLSNMFVNRRGSNG